jgi:uncharacterized protein
MLLREGKTPFRAKAKPTANIKTSAQMCENAVNTKALARREPYPPEKSEAPHKKTAATENAAGLDGIKASTPHEGNMKRGRGLPNHWIHARLLHYPFQCWTEVFVKRIVIAVVLCVFLASLGFAQTGDNAPASKEDVQRYLDATRARDMMKPMVVAMEKPMHQMVHDELLKDGDKLPPDFEARMNKLIDQMMNDLPFDEMINAMIPTYQKHFTKGDMDALTAFYSSPTGQKVLHEMPGIMADSMQSMQPIMSRAMDKMNGRFQEKMAQLIKESGDQPAPAKN